MNVITVILAIDKVAISSGIRTGRKKRDPAVASEIGERQEALAIKFGQCRLAVFLIIHIIDTFSRTFARGPGLPFSATGAPRRG